MEWRRGINEERVIDRPRWSFDVLVTARYVFVWISPAKLRAKHWNIPVSSGSSPFICRLPPTKTLYRGVFTGLMGTASLYQTISGWGTPAGGSEEECYLTHPHAGRAHTHTHIGTQTHRGLGMGCLPPSPSQPLCVCRVPLQTEDVLHRVQLSHWTKDASKSRTLESTNKAYRKHSHIPQLYKSFDSHTTASKSKRSIRSKQQCWSHLCHFLVIIKS